MKKLITITLIFLATTINAQTIYTLNYMSVGVSIDPAMAINGPYKGKINDTNGGKLNGELIVSLHLEKFRLSTAYEWFPHINYGKWTYIMVDYKFAQINVELIGLDTVVLYAGLELSEIRRHSDTFHYSNARDYIENDTTNFLPGVNIGALYSLEAYRWSLGVNWNGFRSERRQREYTNFRHDFMIGIYYNFN